jgi:ELWxxDGT repeat protein
VAATSDHVYFPADDGVSGEELWRTDGTPEGTVFLGDLNPGPDSSEPRPWVASGSKMFFSAWDSVHGRELWQTDERTGDTRLVVDLNPGLDSGANGMIGTFSVVPPRKQPVVWRGRLYFAGTDGSSGVELWSTDGTAWGTRRLADINPGPGSSSPRGFTPFDSKLFFSATDGVTGFEMWVVESLISTRWIFSDGFESGDTSVWSRAEP